MHSTQNRWCSTTDSSPDLPDLLGRVSQGLTALKCGRRHIVLGEHFLDHINRHCRAV